MINYDKQEIRSQLDVEDIYLLLQDWGGEPEYTDFGIISATICHNPPGEGSKKLYFYSNSSLFHCYTGCEDPSFDIFELTMKIFSIQFNKKIDLNDAVRYIAARHGIGGRYEDSSEEEGLEDWAILSNYDRIQSVDVAEKKVITLKNYDTSILDRFNYTLKLRPWLDEGISQTAIEQARIGYFPGGDQITIPHFDVNGRFVGVRGRSLCERECEVYGKYRPLKINRVLYNHPLGMNLYNLNYSKDAIATVKKAVVFESEKSTLLYKSYFGLENDISVACCGFSLSAYQVQLLIEAGAEEIIVAFDRQFKEIGDEEFKRLKANILKLNSKYKNYTNISFIFDKNKITGYKDSPIDCGADKFLTLFKERIVL